MNSINEFTQVGTNFYKRGAKYFRLFGRGVTPNGCWILAPEMREVVEFDIATGKDIFGTETVKFDVTGSVTADRSWACA